MFVAPEAIAARYDEDAWRRVPADVARLVRAWAEPAFKVARDHAGHPDRIYWDPATGAASRRHGPPGSVLVKRAAADFLRPVADAFDAPQKLLGGPNPLTAGLVGGVLGSGLGYGGGYLAEKLLGDRVAPGKLRRAGALAGGALGAAPGLMWGGVNMANPAATGGGAAAWTSKWPHVPGRDDVGAGAAAPLPASRLDERVFHDPKVVTAAVPDAGAFYLPTIPVDAFNNAVWSGVAPASPFGSKSPWGDDSQPLGTPAPVAAAVSGLVAGAGAAAGRPYVSPYHVALAAGLAGGKGYLAGMLAGKVLGALAGLPEDAQESLRDAGLWGGILSGVASTVFGAD